MFRSFVGKELGFLKELGQDSISEAELEFELDA